MAPEDLRACPLTDESSCTVLAGHSRAFSAAAVLGPTLHNQLSQLFSSLHGSSANAFISSRWFLPHPTAMGDQLPRQCPEQKTDSHDDSLINSPDKRPYHQRNGLVFPYGYLVLSKSTDLFNRQLKPSRNWRRLLHYRDGFISVTGARYSPCTLDHHHKTSFKENLITSFHKPCNDLRQKRNPVDKDSKEKTDTSVGTCSLHQDKETGHSHHL